MAVEKQSAENAAFGETAGLGPANDPRQPVDVSSSPEVESDIQVPDPLKQ